MVLPAPLGPSNANTSPGCTAKLQPVHDGAAVVALDEVAHLDRRPVAARASAFSHNEAVLMLVLLKTGCHWPTRR